LVFTLVTVPRRSLSLKLSDARVYEPQALGMSERAGWGEKDGDRDSDRGKDRPTNRKTKRDGNRAR